MFHPTLWEVTPLQVGSIVLDRSAMTHYKGKGETITVPILCAAATDGVHKVLVDTGIRDIAEYQKAEPGAAQSDDQEITAALDKYLGWKPEEIDIVINTHLHVDHCGCNYKFKNAEFYIQRAEWHEAFHPLVPEAPFYDVPAFDKTAVNYFQWKFLDGDFDVLPGCKIITTPGHTRGHQSVLFNTDVGVVCVSGDIANVAENVNGNLEPNIVIEVEQTYKSFERIRRDADWIIPGHEPQIESGVRKYVKIES